MRKLTVATAETVATVATEDTEKTAETSVGPASRKVVHSELNTLGGFLC